MQRIFAFVRDSQGSVIALTAFLLFAFVGLLAVVIDLGHLQATKNELQNSADSGALAGARGLYQPDLGSNVTENVVPDILRARQWAREAVVANWVDKQFGQTISDADIQVGHWDVDTRTFTATCNPNSTDPVNFCNAVRVMTRKDDAANLPVTMGFAKFLGIDSVAVRTEAIAYISWASGVETNSCILPVGIPKCADVPRCPSTTKFSSDNSDTGAWHTFSYQNANADLMRCLLTHCTDNPDESCPLNYENEPLTTGDDVNVNNGEINSVTQATWDIFMDVITNQRNDPNRFTWYPNENDPNKKPGWRTAILLFDCPSGTYGDWKAVQELPLGTPPVACFIVTDVRAAGKSGSVTIDGTTYDYTIQQGEKYIEGCVIEDDSCLGNYVPGGSSGVLTVRPVLVK